MKKNLLLRIASGLFGLSTLSTIAIAQEPLDEHVDKELYPVYAIRRFADSFEAIRQHYYEDTTDAELINFAIDGMLNGLDPHSKYLEPDEYQDVKEHTSGEFVGLGIEIDEDDGLIRIVSPIDDSPAYKAGLQAGDLILALDGDSIRGLGIDDAIELMRGPVGTKIELSILREPSPTPQSFTVERDVIKTNSVRSEMLDKNIGYIRIANFESDTGDELEKHLKELIQNPIEGLLLDLRNNPGGSLNAAVDVSDAFLNSGLIVYTRGRADETALDYEATEGDFLNGAPIIVLINEGSASASEIVAGALRDHKRAIIAGARSFGKGSVQQIISMSEGYGLKLTTALYFTPSGKSIQAQGISPDIDIPLAEVKRIKRSQFSERSLPSHITLKSGETATAEDVTTESPLDGKDNQIIEAYNILTALRLLPNAP